MRRLSLITALGLLVAACGGGGVADRVTEEVAEQVAEQAGGGEVDIEQTDDGDYAVKVEDETGAVVQAGAGALPDDFPFPLPDEFSVGLNIRKDGPDGSEFFAVIQVPGEDVDAMAEKYGGWLESEGFEVERTVLGASDGKMVLIYAERAGDGIIATVDVTSEEVANDAEGNLEYATVISFGWAPSTGGG